MQFPEFSAITKFIQETVTKIMIKKNNPAINIPLKKSLFHDQIKTVTNYNYSISKTIISSNELSVTENLSCIKKIRMYPEDIQ